MQLRFYLILKQMKHCPPPRIRYKKLECSCAFQDSFYDQETSLLALFRSIYCHWIERVLTDPKSDFGAVNQNSDWRAALCHCGDLRNMCIVLYIHGVYTWHIRYVYAVYTHRVRTWYIRYVCIHIVCIQPHVEDNKNPKMTPVNNYAVNKIGFTTTTSIWW